ncbi:hypothetical protein HNQ07_000221 [Deinococcus metalli]|uniref:Bacterial Ig-like domain-containing protein n=1 Tax=Deinococcus metalli TaxID=1141878 RepID=A0A7W8KAQ6_9DEIO|nr:Ig-like domain-containing protein [Deinococcus metalli]MBB5374777.1 hypothetical protein [Deinococcus metalli]GHF33797.1 hypothetical protein GCM10017781_08210 [Deinococcus metalli]
MKSAFLSALTAVLLLTACDDGLAPATPDTTAPAVALSRGTSDTRELALIATATDNVKVTRVEFYQGTTLLATDTTSPFTYTPDLTAARTGFTAKAYDAAGNVGSSAAFDITTRYQGVWNWAVSTPDGATSLDSGTATVSSESGPVGSDGAPSGVGGFENQTGTVSGDIIMSQSDPAGTLSATLWKVEKTAGAILVTTYISGTDGDNTLTTVQGKTTFEGSGWLHSEDGSNQPVRITLVQSSAELP